MRIIYLHQYFNLPTDPGGTRSYEMARRLVEAGHEVYMITSDRDGRFSGGGWQISNEAGIEVHWLPVDYDNKMSYPQRIKAFLKFALSAARRAAGIPADVVFATSTPLTIALPGVYAARRQRIPMVFEVRDLWPTVPIALGVINNPILKKLSYWLEKFAYKNSAMIVALAPGMSEEIIKTGYPAQKMAIIPNGADIQLFQQTSTEGITKHFPWTIDNKVISYIGTIGLANGVEYLPELASEIKKIEPDTKLRFAIIGDGKFKSQVLAHAEKLGVLNELIFFIGKLPKGEIPDWLEISIATIMTYSGPEILYRDSVSNKFFDSLAAGKPVFANFKGFSTLIANQFEAGGFLDEDPQSAAKQLIKITNDPQWLQKASMASSQLGQNYFDRKKLADKLETVLTAVTTNHYPDRIIGEEFMELWKNSRVNSEG